MGDYEPNAPETIENATGSNAESEVNKSNAVEPLAAQLSDLMNNPELPVEFFNAFQGAFDNLRNDLTGDKSQMLLAHELTPQYMTDFLNCFLEEE